uniref:Type IV pilus secretin PilQ n=1 Tax=Eiseniibacteriota bacterium TaxID=2212470 RepID=A0A832I3L8_UNCEI
MRSAKGLIGLVLTVAAFAALSTAPAAAQQPSSTMQQVGLVRTGAGTFSLDVEGADIRTVVRAIAEFSGRNIVVGKDVKGTVKVSLRNVGWQEAFRSVLRSTGLDYVDDNGILRVDDMTKLHAEMVDREQARARAAELVPLETRIVKLNYANAAELMGALQNSLTKRGSIQVERRTNSIIISDLESQVDKVEAMAMKLDSETPQIEITAKLVDVDAEALRGLGVEWNVGPTDGTDAEFFSSVPAPGAQYLNPGNDGNNALGGSQNTSIADPAATITYGIAKSWGFIEAQLSMLEQNRKANIISNPRITTVDNREAKILVGQKIPLIVQDIAGNPVSQLQTIGIQLKVTPHLTQEKKIIMDLHPEVSDLSTQSTVQGGVIINTSEADTRVMVEDGQTAVIGGLIRTNDSNVRKGIPLLKDVPLIGALFRSDNTVRQNRELIIFVTPKIIQTMAAAE